MSKRSICGSLGDQYFQSLHSFLCVWRNFVEIVSRCHHTQMKMGCATNVHPGHLMACPNRVNPYHPPALPRPLMIAIQSAVIVSQPSSAYLPVVYKEKLFATAVASRGSGACAQLSNWATDVPSRQFGSESNPKTSLHSPVPLLAHGPTQSTLWLGRLC